MLPIIPPPKGFKIFYSPNSELLLVYRPNGMRYLLIFAIICLLAWILFCIFIATLLITSFILIQDYLISILTFIFFFIPLVMHFFAAQVFNQAYIILYFFLAKASFDLRFDCLVFNEKFQIFKLDEVNLDYFSSAMVIFWHSWNTIEVKTLLLVFRV